MKLQLLLLASVVGAFATTGGAQARAGGSFKLQGTRLLPGVPAILELAPAAVSINQDSAARVGQGAAPVEW
jgi:hypothetical protein